MTIDEQIAVMQAFKDGKSIECAGKDRMNWSGVVDPGWDWKRFDYRVKPEPKIRPYSNEMEFMQEQQKHGMYLGRKKMQYGNEWIIPNRIYDGGVKWINYNGSSMAIISWSQLVESCNWIDGTPCGIVEAE